MVSCDSRRRQWPVLSTITPIQPAAVAQPIRRPSETALAVDLDPTRVAQFAALTFLIGAGFLLVGYALS